MAILRYHGMILHKAHTDFLLIETDLLAADCTTPREKAVENAAAGAVPPDSGAKSSLRSSPAPAGREAADTALLFDAFRQVCARCLCEIFCGAPLRMSAWA